MMVLFSCLEESISSQEDTALITEDAIMDSYYEDTDDLISLVLLSDDIYSTGGRVANSRLVSLNDSRFACSGVAVTVTPDPKSTLEKPMVTILIDFGDACTDAQGNVRKGRIKVQIEGHRFRPGSTVVATFQQYYINGIALFGIRKLTNISTSTAGVPRFSIELTNAMAIWPDGTQTLRQNCVARTWLRAINPLNDAIVVENCDGMAVAATGTNRLGREYQIRILEPMLFKRGCPIAVKGVKEITDLRNNKVMIINYGEGECDRTITLTIDGNSRKVEVKKRS